MKNIGLKIRSDSPALLKQIIEKIKEAVENYKLKLDNVPSTIEFILSTLNDIKMNKKVEGDLTENSQFLGNWLSKNIIQKMSLGKKLYPLTFE